MIYSWSATRPRIPRMFLGKYNISYQYTKTPCLHRPRRLSRYLNNINNYQSVWGPAGKSDPRNNNSLNSINILLNFSWLRSSRFGTAFRNNPLWRPERSFSRIKRIFPSSRLLRSFLLFFLRIFRRRGRSCWWNRRINKFPWIRRISNNRVRRFAEWFVLKIARLVRTWLFSYY